jgi:hypothetical protein
VKGKVGRSAKLYKIAQMCQSLSQNLLSMEDSKNLIPVVDKNNHPSKEKKLSLFYK